MTGARTVMFLLGVGAGVACSAGTGLPPSRWATAVLSDGSAFTLEVADTEAARVRGYMGRERVGPAEGMLFVFEAPDRHAFWMKDCRVPLDILWLDGGFRVVEVAPAQPPCPPEGSCPSLAPMRPALYALELAAGTAKAHGLLPGTRIEVLRPDGTPW